jgi:hypothetical protein
MLSIVSTCNDIESTYRLFTAANDDRDLANFCPNYFSGLGNLSIESFRSRIEMWVTDENVNLFQPTPLDIVTRRLCNLSINPTEYHKLNEIASYLIAKGAKFHKLEYWGEQTCLLMAAISSTVHAFDSRILGKRFLEMLAASNVDVAEYLAFERQNHPQGLTTAQGLYGIWPYCCDPRAVKLDINEEQPFSLSWDWWADPEGPAFTVLQEFRNFGQVELFLDGGELVPDYGRLLYWPFIYPDWTWGISGWPIEKEKTLLERVQQRSDHRWNKKMIKQAKMQGTYKKPKMPGSWIH